MDHMNYALEKANYLVVCHSPDIGAIILLETRDQGEAYRHAEEEACKRVNTSDVIRIYREFSAHVAEIKVKVTAPV